MGDCRDFLKILVLQLSKTCLNFSCSPRNRGACQIFVSHVSLCSVLPTHPTLPSFLFPLCLFASKVLHNDDDSGRRPGSVSAACGRRTELFIPPVTELAVVLEPRAERMPESFHEHQTRPPELPAHSHCWEEVVSLSYSDSCQGRK